MMYTYDSLEKLGFSGMTDCFQKAFSDYALQVTCDETYLSRRFKGSGIDFSKSFGAFWDGELIGFVLNAVGAYQGASVIFDAATAVVPEHRGKGVYTHLMECIREALKKGDLEKYVLEVLQSNDRAIKLYKRMGFEITREFVCFRGSETVCPLDGRFAPSSLPLADFPLQSTESFVLFDPSFENRAEAVQNLADDYQVLYTGAADQPASFVIYQRAAGQVKICGRRPGRLEELKRLLCYLNGQFREIAVYNIDYKDEELVTLLKDCGFSHYCDQFQMELNIT